MIIIKSLREIELIRRSSEVLIEAFTIVDQLIKAGIRTDEINDAVEELICSKGARPAFKGYNDYPASICASIDDEVVHGIPSDRILEEGQILSIDIGVEMNNYYSDAARTYPVGQISADKVRLLKVTREALYKGIEAAHVGNRLSDISNAIQTHVEDEKFSVVRDLVGHGIGRKLHEEPQIPNYGKPDQGPRLKAGMVFAIEPMVNMGHFEVYTADDLWTVCTRDGSPSAHFEHTITITEDGPEILTGGLSY